MNQVTAQNVEKVLEELFSSQILRAQTYHPVFSRLWTITRERFVGGKRIRPSLMMDMYFALVNQISESQNSTVLSEKELADGTQTDSSHPAIQTAAAIELLHYSFLLHDDVIDGDLMRRGAPNLIGFLVEDTSDVQSQLDLVAGQNEVATLHWARSCGILMGDLLLSEVHQIIARLDVATPLRIRLLDLISHTITESVSGEQLDVGLSARMLAPEMSTVLEMCRLKTATYTFELPLRAAAILAGADEKLEALLSSAGVYLGLAFQLQDDVLSTFGNSELHGKDPYSDLREGKETVVIAYARTTSAWDSIAPIFGTGTLTPSEGDQIRDLLRSCGAETFVLNLINKQILALNELIANHTNELSVPARTVLLSLVSSFEGRSV